VIFTPSFKFVQQSVSKLYICC